jgi:hypothetical protein
MKFALLATLAAALFTTGVASSNKANAMTLSGVLDAGATVDVAQPEQVRWCGSRGCWARYRQYDYYRPWPYYYPGTDHQWGWDWPRCLQVALLRC